MLCLTSALVGQNLSLATRTIRNWAANGLRLMSDVRPALLRGDDEQQLAERVRAHLCAQRQEAAT